MSVILTPPPVRIYMMSDTHGLHGRIQVPLSRADICIHAGDISNIGEAWDVENFLYWYNSLEQFKYKIFIAGNHDFLFEKDPDKAKELLAKYPNLIYLENSSIEIMGLKIYGSPYTPEFCNWAFNLRRGEPLKACWSLIPDDTDILITHGPVYGIHDQLENSEERVGCIELKDRIEQLHNLKLHVCGHIHCGHGAQSINKILYINASLVNERYKVVNNPFITHV